MASNSKLSDWVKWPAWVLGAITATAILLGAFGFGFSTPGEKWDEHDVQHIAEELIHSDNWASMDNALSEINDRHMEQQTLVEAIVRGECIENPRENLERQGLITKCRELGIER